MAYGGEFPVGEEGISPHKDSRRMAGKNITLQIAKKCLSYYGYFKHTNSRRIERKWKVRKIIKKCKGVIRNESKILAATASC